MADLGQTQPMDIAFLPGRRVVVAKRAGGLSLYGGATLAALDDIPGVVTSGERGLLSLAVDPGFSHNGYVYAYFSHQTGFNRVSRFTCAGDLAIPDSVNITLDTSSERVVLGSLPDGNPNHNGGSLRFGPDGMLYLSVGDDKAPCDAQDFNSKRGCLLRFNPSGLPDGPSQTEPSLSLLDPGDNPMSGGPGFSRIVIAHGLRNPFRMEIDPSNGDVFIGDVGGDQAEEISCYEYQQGNMQLENFGWPWREGLVAGLVTCPGTAPSNLSDPIAVEPHGNADALILGSLYRNMGRAFDFGGAYDGDLFYTDWFDGNGRRLTKSASQGWVIAPPVPGQSSTTYWVQSLRQAAAWRQGCDGSLWFVQRPHWASPTARLARIRRANMSANTVTIVAGDGQVTNAATVFTQPLVLEVRDGAGALVSGASVGIEVLGPGEQMGQSVLITDASGRVATSIRAMDKSGEVRVLATTPGDVNGVTAELYSRRLTVTHTPSEISLRIDNATQASPPSISYFISAAFGTSVPLPTVIGPLCVNPFGPQSIVIEDSTGLFNFVSFSGLGSVGDPSLERSYPYPTSTLAGLTMQFEAVGFDPVGGWFQTNCETVGF